MAHELEQLFTQTAEVTARERLRGDCAAGEAVVGGETHPCYALGGRLEGKLPVIAFGLRGDGSHVLICGEGHIIKPEIRVTLGEQEKGTQWTCYYEHSCGALLYTRSGGTLRYLVIQGTGGHIGFPKGHIEDGEDIADAVRRELREEVGVTRFQYVDGYRVDSHVITRKRHHKDVTYFLASFDPSRSGVRRQEEEIVHIWLLEYEEARKRVNTELDRELLDKAHALLSEKTDESGWNG